MARVLIVDDDAALREIWSIELARTGNEVVAARNGVEGLKFIESETFDVVLLDLSMPRLDGLQLLQLVRSKRPQLPIVAVTAGTDPDASRAVVAAGADDILFKPIPLDELSNIVARVARQI